jgi:hypothetical protein
MWVYTGHYTPLVKMDDRYVPPAWRNRGGPTSSSSTRGSFGQADDRELSTHAGRNQARGRGAMRAPDFSGTSRWQNTETAGRSSGGDIWSSLPASNVPSSSSRDEPGLRKPNPSASSYRPTPTRFSNEDRTTRSAIQARRSPSTSLPPRPNTGDARTWNTSDPFLNLPLISLDRPPTHLLFPPSFQEARRDGNARYTQSIRWKWRWRRRWVVRSGCAGKVLALDRRQGRFTFLSVVSKPCNRNG